MNNNETTTVASSKKFLTKDEVINNKKASIKKLNQLLEGLINDGNPQHLKKANLISYWLKDYVSLIDFEETFDPTRNISYKRGNIVKLNFGFNIGCEYGGLHYAVVLDEHNHHNSPVVTVIPLTSIKDDQIVHENSVELGNELYRLLKLKHDTISKTLSDEQKELNLQVDSLEKTINQLTSQIVTVEAMDKTTPDYAENVVSLRKAHSLISDMLKDVHKKVIHNQEELEYLNKITNEISRMKQGSIALINQITTISKMRIFDPRNIHGVLSGISLSGETMDKINDKVKELYVR